MGLLCAASFAAFAGGLENRLVFKSEEVSLDKFAGWKLSPLKKVEGFAADGSQEKWAALPAADLPAIPSQVQIPKWQGDKDLSFRLQAAWDDSNLYLGITVRDNVHLAQASGEMWRKDSVQIAFASASGFGPEYGLALVEGTPEVFRWSAGDAVDSVSAVKLNVSRKGETTFYDVALPWTSIWAKRPDGPFRMDVIVNDCDESERLGWIELTPGIGKTKDQTKFAIFSLDDPKNPGKMSVSLETPPVLSTDRGSVSFKAMLFNPGQRISEPLDLKVSDISGKKVAGLNQSVSLAKGLNEVSCEWFPSMPSGRGEVVLSAKIGNSPFSERKVSVVTDKAFGMAISQAEASLEDLKKTYDAAKAASISDDYAKAAIAVARRFIPIAKERESLGALLAAIDDADFVGSLCKEQNERLKLVVAGKAKALSVPDPKLDKLEIRDGNFWAGTQPVMLVGGMGFGELQADFPVYRDFGFNSIDFDFVTDASFNMLKGEKDGAGVFDEKAIPKTLEWWKRCADSNLAISFVPTLHYFPFWAMRKYVDITGGDEVDCLPDWSGLRRHEGRRSKVYGAFFPFAIDSANLRRLVGLYYGKLMPELAKAPGFSIVWLMNEPTYTKSDDPNYLNLYRAFLKKKYGTAEELNRKWGSSYADFDKIAKPLKSGDPAKFDFMTFHQDQVASWFEWLAAEARKGNPSTPLSNKPMAWTLLTPENGIDFEREAELWEVPGCDSCRRPISGSYSFEWQDPITLFDFQKSVAPSKPLADFEYHYGEFPGLTAEYARATYFQSYLHGLRKSEFWVWSKGELDPAKPQGAGMQDTNWGQPKCAWGTCTSALDLRRLSKQIAAFPQRPEAMVYFSKPSLFLDSSVAAQGIRNAHEALNSLDAPTGFATDKMIRAGKLKGLKLLVIPEARHVEADVAKGIADFVAAGGKLVLMNECLVKDEAGKPLDNGLAAFSKSIFKASGKSPKDYVAALDAALDASGVSRPVRVMTLDGKPAWPVESRTAVVDGKRVCYLIGLNKEPMKVRLKAAQPVAAFEDLVTGERVEGDSLEIKPMDVRLLSL